MWFAKQMYEMTPQKEKKKKTIDSALSYVHFKFIKCIHASLLIKNLLALQTK